ncbi:type I toxin-antitoxin system Fst family toxin [Staphylococcus pettenkoferi]|nr:type I toxin-antitoxin system Fst family toxin [Staphylococcus pettenkoferi]MCY1573144.1 type I toxin-antitoxin system Fst family toxin [Staphylococcus pettenkoferi]MCY1579306.1 type I toxin-antitoxin system Fst family toxin [Staphylococcus pettenkoferi]
MTEVVYQIVASIISGCIIAMFTQWLRHRNEKK